MMNDHQRKHVAQVVTEYQQQGSERRRGALRCLLAGAMAGAVSRTAVTPLSVIKSVSQLRLENLHDVNNANMGWKDTIQSVHRAGGLRMFWLANTPALFRVAPLTGLKFALYEPLYGYWTLNPDASLYRARFISGAMASGTASLLLYPLDVLKTQVTVVKLTCLAAKKSIPALPSLAAAQSLWQRGGFSGVTRGIGVSAIGAGFHGGLIFMAYHSLRSWLPSGYWWADSTPLSAFACGGLAGAFAQLTYPFDLIRKTALHHHKHSFDTVHMLVRQGGLLGLYKGSVANLFKVAPYFALQFCIYEMLVRLHLFDRSHQ